MLISSCILLLTYVLVYHKLHKNKCYKKHTKILHLRPQLLMCFKLNGVSGTGWAVAWKCSEGQHLLNVTHHHVIPCAVLSTEKPSVLSFPHPSQNLRIIRVPVSRGRSWTSWCHQPSLLPPLKPHPSFLLKCISIQGSLILKISFLDTPPSQIYCHTFCSPKIINVP